MPTRKRLVLVRLDPEVLDWFRAQGPATRRGSTPCCGPSWRTRGGDGPGEGAAASALPTGVGRTFCADTWFGAFPCRRPGPPDIGAFIGDLSRRALDAREGASGAVPVARVLCSGSIHYILQTGWGYGWTSIYTMQAPHDVRRQRRHTLDVQVLPSERQREEVLPEVDVELLDGFLLDEGCKF